MGTPGGHLPRAGYNGFLHNNGYSAMNQFWVTLVVFLAIVGIMGLGMLISGRPFRRSCGGVGGDKSECGICDGGAKPEKSCEIT